MNKSITPNQIGSTDFNGVSRVLAVRLDDASSGVNVWTARTLAPLYDEHTPARVQPVGDILITVADPDDVSVRADLEARVFARRKEQGLTAR